MVMGFFRRTDDSGKPNADTTGGAYSARSDLETFHSFGAVIAESEMSSQDLLSGLGGLQERIATLLREHGLAIDELSGLKSERARITSLLEYETTTRSRLETENNQLSSENKELKYDNSQIKLELDELRERSVQLQTLYDANARDLELTQKRLSDVSRELDERVSQYDNAAALMKRAHQDLDQRNREILNLREKYENERTAHQVLSETSRRESETQTRDLARLTEERTELKKRLADQENQTRSISTEAMGLRQEISFTVDKLKRAQSELENLRSASSVEIAQLTTRQEATASKAELVEKLLVTARARSKSAEDELQGLRNELKESKSELATATLRAERLANELASMRSETAEDEGARRELQLQASEFNTRMRDAENLRIKREREYEAAKRDLDHRAFGDKEEIRQLRTTNEGLRAEINQLKAEVAILSGQLNVARTGRSGQPATMPKASYEEWVPNTAEAPRPIIELSEESLRKPSPSLET